MPLKCRGPQIALFSSREILSRSWAKRCRTLEARIWGSSTGVLRKGILQGKL